MSKSDNPVPNTISTLFSSEPPKLKPPAREAGIVKVIVASGESISTIGNNAIDRITKIKKLVLCPDKPNIERTTKSKRTGTLSLETPEAEGGVAGSVRVSLKLPPIMGPPLIASNCKVPVL